MNTHSLRYFALVATVVCATCGRAAGGAPHVPRAELPRAGQVVIPRDSLPVARTVSMPQSQDIDLSCDVIVFEPERDSTRIEVRRGQAWSDSTNTVLGALVVRPAAFRAGEPPDAPVRVRVFRPEGQRSVAGEFTSAPILVSDSAGRARLEISCPHCTKPTVWVEFPRGRTDTLDVYLTRLRNTCEIDAAREALKGRRAPPNGSW